MKRYILLALFAIAVMLSVAVFVPGSSATAATPSYPASQYLKDVTVGNQSNPLDYNTGGMRLLLTPLGDQVGVFWSGAQALAQFSISSWEQETHRTWPYYRRSRDSVAREIQANCLAPWIDTTTRPTTISLNGW